MTPWSCERVKRQFLLSSVNQLHNTKKSFHKEIFIMSIFENIFAEKYKAAKFNSNPQYGTMFGTIFVTSIEP
jgi:hypothetical protein